MKALFQHLFSIYSTICIHRKKAPQNSDLFAILRCFLPLSRRLPPHKGQ